MGAISLLTAKSQGSVERHLELSGWKPVWRSGEPTNGEPDGETLDDGIIEGKNASISRIRSAEIPWRVSTGTFDAGLVGTDCLLDHLYSKIYVRGGFAYGRQINGLKQAYLAAFIREDSPYRDFSEFPAGSVVMTERPHLTKTYLESQGISSEIFFGGNENAYGEFHEKIKEDGKLLIKIIDGAGGQQIQQDEILLMVGESGRRSRNYNLRELGIVCEIETLLLINELSITDRNKREGLFQLEQDLNRVAISQEKERKTELEEPGKPMSSKER